MNITLTDREKHYIKHQIENVIYNHLGSDCYITQIRQIGYNIIPDRILHILEIQKNRSNLSSYILIDNLPSDDYIYGSPKFNQSGIQFKSGYISENLICMFGAILGEPYSVYFEGQELVNNLTPHPEASDHYTGLGSSVELDLHVENAALRFLGNHDYSPLGLLLIGVREQKHDNNYPYTNIADARLALNKLNKNDIEILKSNSYIIKLPHRWRQAFANIKDCTYPCPMISGNMNTFRVNAVFYPEMVIALNAQAKTAFNNFYTALRNVMVRINITPGKLLYIDNQIALHSRDKFIARYDQNQTAYRWVQRLFIRSNLGSLQTFSHNRTRVFNPNIETFY